MNSSQAAATDAHPRENVRHAYFTLAVLQYPHRFCFPAATCGSIYSVNQGSFQVDDIVVDIEPRTLRSPTNLIPATVEMRNETRARPAEGSDPVYRKAIDERLTCARNTSL
nr:hypothetical protein CFP56_39024 [Quercus suber]